MERLPVGVVVVNWNGGALLDACLDALVGQGAARVLVVDNGSEPEELRRLGARDGVDVLPLAENHGFAPASNFGSWPVPKCDAALTMNGGRTSR